MTKCARLWIQHHWFGYAEQVWVIPNQDNLFPPMGPPKLYVLVKVIILRGRGRTMNQLLY